MPEYIFTGTAKVSGVTFFVRAANEAEAKKKAKAGDHHCPQYTLESAEVMTDWSLDPDTCKFSQP